MDNKKKAITATAIVGVLAAGAISTLGDNTQLYGSYNIEKSQYKAVISVEMPEEFSPDICTLKFNDYEVDKELLPDGEFVVYPLLADAPENLTLECLIKGEEAGVAEFLSDGRLKITAKKKHVAEGRENETEQ